MFNLISALNKKITQIFSNCVEAKGFSQYKYWGGQSRQYCPVKFSAPLKAAVNGQGKYCPIHLYTALELLPGVGFALCVYDGKSSYSMSPFDTRDIAGTLEFTTYLQT